MNLDSVRSFKRQVSDEIVAEQGTTMQALSFFEATEPPMPAGMGLGISLGTNGEHLLAIRTEDPAAAAQMAARVNGEADIRIVRVAVSPPVVDPLSAVDAQTTPGFLQGRVRPIEPGAQLNINGANFVGTLGAIVKDAAGRLFGLSNSHVIADMGLTPIGTAIGQPFAGPNSMIGILERFVPLSQQSPNLVDCAIMRLDHTQVLRAFNGALQDNLKGVRALHPSELGADVLKIGRTTGVRRGKITAVEIDGLPVGYDALGVLHFNDQIEITGGAATDFSAAGDSGSLIIRPDGLAVALLFAGGVSGGVDSTYGNRLETVLEKLGVSLAA